MLVSLLNCNNVIKLLARTEQPTYGHTLTIWSSCIIKSRFSSIDERNLTTYKIHKCYNKYNRNILYGLKVGLIEILVDTDIEEKRF